MKIGQIKDFFNELIFEIKLSNIVRVGKKALENFQRANSNLWVSSLCFYTIVSLVPIFAIIFSLGNWLGLNDEIFRNLIEYSPLNQESIEILISFAQNFLENTRTGILAGAGFLFLGWTLIYMFSTIEEAFNSIWNVDKPRHFIRKITDYISFIVLLPTLLAIGVGLVKVIITKFNNNILNTVSIFIEILPFFSLLLFFTIIYMMVPNTRVKFVPAFISAIFISLFFSGSQSLFILLQGMINTYNKIYGSFSVIFIFFVWLKIMWFFVILGVHLSYLLQNRVTYTTSNQINKISFYTKEYIAIILINEIIYRYRNSLAPLTLNEAAKKYNIPIEVSERILRSFIAVNFIGEINYKDGVAYSILKNIDNISFGSIFEILENSGQAFNQKLAHNPEIVEIIKNKKFDFLIKNILTDD